MSQKNVLYGEREKRSFPEQQSVRIFFDREGSVYPDYLIADADMLKAGASLRQWYTEHPEDFEKIRLSEGLKPAAPDDKSIGELQDSLLTRYARNINSSAAVFDDICLLIHGFRKPFREQNNGDYSSVKDFDTLRRQISSYGKKKHLFVELYWDAMYDCCFSAKNLRKNKAIMKLFEKEASVNALHSGYSVRKLLRQLDSKPLKVISHSLGARVLTTALFNTDSTDKRYSTEEAFRTPANKSISICLIAPAIGGSETFSCYYNRNAATDYKIKDNYRLLVVYNEKDFVLMKRDPKFFVVGPGPRKYGVTTLGCNYHGEVEKVTEQFRCNYPGSEIKTLDFTPMGEHHHLRNYVGYPLFAELVRFMEDDLQ